MNLRKIAILLAFLSTGFGIASADEVNKPSIEDFAFLAGYWQGTGFGGQSEEVWMPPANGRMFGIFTQYDDGELVFSEFMEIGQTDGEFYLRLKHFNPDFSGWEEKTDYVTFKFESVSGSTAVFSGLSYEVHEERELTISLRLRMNDGSLSTEQFKFSRVDL